MGICRQASASVWDESTVRSTKGAVALKPASGGAPGMVVVVEGRVVVVADVDDVVGRVVVVDGRVVVVVERTVVVVAVVVVVEPGGQGIGSQAVSRTMKVESRISRRIAEVSTAG